MTNNTQRSMDNQVESLRMRINNALINHTKNGRSVNFEPWSLLRDVLNTGLFNKLDSERQEAEKWRMAFNTVIDQKGDLLQEKIRYFEEAEKLRQVIGYNPKIDDMDSITYAQAVMQQFREAVKEVEKLHQENEVLKNEIQNLRSYCMVTFGESHPEMRKCIHELENEALKAQVEGLVGALEKIVNERGMTLECASKVMSIIDEALSTLPSTFLEIQKAKDACVEAIKKSISMAQQRCDGSFGSWDSIYNVRGYCIAKPLEKALRTLQLAQDLAGQSKKEDV